MGARFHCALRPLFAAALLVPLEAAGDTAAAGEAAAQFVGSRNRSFEWWASRAVAAARARLSDPRCLQVFSDFRDASGRTLQSRLDERRLTARGYLDSLLFVDGDREAFCQSARVLAGTRPGSRVLRLCGSRFGRFVFHDPGFAAAVILHEELHSLGLQENPPSPDEITRRILARCGR